MKRYFSYIFQSVFSLGLGVYEYVCTRAEYVIYGRVPGSRVQSGFTLNLTSHFSIKVALLFIYFFKSCICRLGSTDM